MPAPAFRASALDFSYSAPKPSGVVEGDIIFVVCVVYDSTTTITGPSGFTALTSQFTVSRSGARQTVRVYYKIAGASEPSTWSWSSSPSDVSGSFVVAYQVGTFDAASPIDGTPTTNTGNSSTMTALGVTTSVADSLLIATIFGWNDSSGNPSGMTRRLQEGSAGLMWEEARASPGASGNRTLTQSPGDIWSAAMWALKALPSAKPRFHAQIIG